MDPKFCIKCNRLLSPLNTSGYCLAHRYLSDAYKVKRQRYHHTHKDKEKAYRAHKNPPVTYPVRPCPICGTPFAKLAKCCSRPCSTKAYVVAHPKEINTRKRKRHHIRMSQDPAYKVKVNIRKRVRNALKCKGLVSKGCIRFLGCSSKELIDHLESKFQPGMSWDNYGTHGWHIDHIKPLSSFDLTQEESLKVVCHYTNLQPLWAEDNIRKSNKTV